MAKFHGILILFLTFLVSCNENLSPIEFGIWSEPKETPAAGQKAGAQEKGKFLSKFKTEFYEGETISADIVLSNGPINTPKLYFVIQAKNSGIQIFTRTETIDPKITRLLIRLVYIDKADQWSLGEYWLRIYTDSTKKKLIKEGLFSIVAPPKDDE